MTYEVTIPEIGESITEAVILRWIRNPGDHVGRDEPLVELETDKVTVEMPSPVAGVVSEIVAAEGETVPIGGVIARIEEGAAATAGSAPATVGAQTDLLAAAAAPPPVNTPAPPAAPATPQVSTTAEAPRILPAAKRLIAEHDLDAGAIPATGKGGRLLKSDVVAYLASSEAEEPAPAEPTPATAPPAAAPAPVPPAAPAAPPATPPPPPPAPPPPPPRPRPRRNRQPRPPGPQAAAPKSASR